MGCLLMANILKDLIWAIQPKKIYGLVGGPGTGKSFRAFLVAEKYNIQFIIDDGLLLKGQKILAGKSAKEEKLHITAVKRAIFFETKHAREVRKKLIEERYNSILILATSDNMFYKIMERLHLKSPVKIIKIEDIATEEEIKTARKSRVKEGKHVIPIPLIEVKKKYPNLVLHALHMFNNEKTGGLFRTKKQKTYEKTIIRPNFGTEGKISISEEAIVQMITHCVAEYSNDIVVLKVKLDETPENYAIHLDVAANYSSNNPSDFIRLQNVIKDKINDFTGLNIKVVSIEIKKSIGHPSL